MTLFIEGGLFPTVFYSTTPLVNANLAGGQFLTIILCLIVTFTLTGCVKVVEIGKEDELTCNKKFDAAKNVQGLWSSQAVSELTCKAVDLATVPNKSGGELFMGDEKIHFRNVSQARAHGIALFTKN